jgi:tight adherence protein C
MGASIGTITMMGAFLAIVGGLLVLLALRTPAPTTADLVADRLDAFDPPEQLMNLDDREAALSFRDRVLLPTVQRLGAALSRRTPEGARVQLHRELGLAGHPFGLSATDFVAVRYFCAGAGALVGGLLGVLSGKPAFILLAAVMCAVVGLIAPKTVLSSRVKKARAELRRTLPDAMDLMSVCVEAGLTFEAAMSKVSDRYLNVLGAEFGQVLREIRLGRSRRDAMQDLGARSGVEEVLSFAQAVVQSDALGTGIAKILRMQGEELRRKKRQRAQERGAKAAVKMLIPMVLFIFPSLWIVLLGPAGLLLLKMFGPGGH